MPRSLMSDESTSSTPAGPETATSSVPSISLPKGGGAIRGIGEKFGVQPVNGTGSMSVPIATSPGRSGFGPQLSLSYDSGAGNGPFGFGWSLSLPSITRKTDKGLPRYVDDDESDVFILSGSEDLVPVSRQAADGSWVHDEHGHLVVHEDELDGYLVRRYRPRIEGLHARIERWIKIDEPDNVHWRSISRDNILTIYGFDATSRITDPANAAATFSWLICETRDDKGNGLVYSYKPEDGVGVDLAKAHERNRGTGDDPRRSANRYLKRIRYGNRAPLLDADGLRPRVLDQAQIDDAGWMFEVVFDYGEHDQAAPTPGEVGSWLYRSDPFSTYRAGFEVRTTRVCRRVLMFHHFAGEVGVGDDCLVRSTDLTYSEGASSGQGPIYTFLNGVIQTGYRRRDGGGYDKQSLPPVEFEYTQPFVQQTVKDVDPASLENLPIGLDGSVYRWTDLHGEGVAGILTEQAEGWFYKRNLSPMPVVSSGRDLVEARFGRLETVALKPDVTLRSGAELMDLAGDGQPDLVVLDGPTPGLFEHDLAEGWQPFRPFTARLNRDLHDPNLKFVDLDGDGHADVLITEDDALVWHPSLDERGFGPAQRVSQSLDEERGPRVVFADGTQSVYLADMSGDGLTDIARVRNGEVCYWPNLGYGRFGAKVAMDDAPWFDRPDQFDQKRIRLADIDGSGTTDIVYLHGDGVRLYFNQSGNGWSRPQALDVFPHVGDLANIVPIDLLGNGTACLVWSSLLPADAGRPMRYVNLMGDDKPHLLVRMANNLGAETIVDYAPSTKFYLQDKRDGRPWITRLPFPVHVVERVVTIDHIGRNRFTTRYAYHHGCFDGDEREFRGFGMVEQFDTEQLAALDGSVTPASVSALPAGNVDVASHVPPVRTKTWFHTGVRLGREHISDFFAGLLDASDGGEYFREPGLTDDDGRALLLPDTVLPAELTIGEEREACRALKGSMLRQEIYALDGSEREPFPYTVTEQTFSVATVQPRGANRHPVFFTHAREAINFHYERNPADPRIQHTLTLEVDPYGTVLKEAAVAYGRRPTIRVADGEGHIRQVPNPGLAGLLADDAARQTTTLVTYTENRVTNAVDATDEHRVPLPCETRTFELTGYTATGQGSRFQASDLVEPDPNLPGRLRHRFRAEVPYEAAPSGIECRRTVEWGRMLYRQDDLSAALPLGELQSLAHPYEGYKLAFTPGLLAQVFQRSGGAPAPEPLLPIAAAVLESQAADGGGYVGSQTLKADGRFPSDDADDHWWIPSGRSFFTDGPDDDAGVELAAARQHFFVPRRYRDAFAHDTVVRHDTHDLLVVETRDPLGNRVSVEANDYRVLRPALVSDPNHNRSAVAFDMLGLVVGTAVMGKPAPAPEEGDTLTGFAADLSPTELAAFFDAPNPRLDAPALLGGATTRIVYDLDRFDRSRRTHPDDPSRWQPVGAATITRETHVSDLAPGASSELHIGVSYSDGFGREIQKKAQAEPGPVVADGPMVDPRWVGSGWTIYNNKGKPVRQFEPFFTAAHAFEHGSVVGVSPVLFYDPVERVVATLHPNRTYEKVRFDPWAQTTFDVNDTVAPRNAETGDPRSDPDVAGYVRAYFAALPIDPAGPWKTWHQQRTASALDRERDAALRAEAHADTPTTVHLDVLSRPFLTVARNRVVCPGHDLDGTEEVLDARVELDIEGNQRSVRDAIEQAGDPLGRVVMRYGYDMLGRRTHQLSMEAGARWTLDDVAGKPIRTWDSRGHNTVTAYDELRRPVSQTVRGTTADSDPRILGRDVLAERIEYGEGRADAEALNLRTRVYRNLDAAGVLTHARLDATGTPTEAFDFKGNPLASTRQLVADYAAVPDWQANPALEVEAFLSSTRYDALNRPVQSVAPHSSLRGPERKVIQPVFNEANLLERVDVWLEHPVEPVSLLDPANDAPSPVGVANVDYDAKGQRLRIDYKNGASTRYTYDTETFRLTHLYTRRGETFTDDCDNPSPPPATIAAPETPVAGTPCGLQNLRYTYDPAGNITHIHDDAQQVIYFRNRRVEPSNDFAYDALYRLIEATGREHLGQAGGAPIPHSHDDAGRVGLLHPGDGNAMGTYIERYVYDAVGNLLAMQHRGSDPANPGWSRGYTYGETSLTEDGTGGNLTKTSNRLTSITLNPKGSNPVVEPYLHDVHGNMVRMPHLGGGAAAPNMDWDHKDQLRHADLGGGGAAYFVYDASGERVRKVWEKAPGLIEERIYLGGFEVFRRHAGAIGAAPATFERETLHVMDGRKRIALVETRTFDVMGNDLAPRELIRYQFGNHLGSASVETDSQAQLISYEEYCPYGSATYQAGGPQTESPKRYRYTGKERDDESGFMYHGARYYSPWLGRWTSCDVVAKPNRYAYARDNPITYVDHDGREETEPGLLERFRRSDTGQFLGGVVEGTLSSFVPGGFLLAPIGQQAGVLNQPTRAFQAGYGAGEFATGVSQVGGGAGGEIGGGLLDLTGIGALVGVPINVAAAAVIVQGSGNVVVGASNFVQAIRRDPEPAAVPNTQQPEQSVSQPPPAEPPPSTAKPPPEPPPVKSSPGTEPPLPNAPRPAKPLNWSPKSRPTFGHTFETHGAGPKSTKGLTGRAAGTKQPQGQWLNNEAAADLLKKASESTSGPRTIPIPEGMGRVVMPDGSFVPAAQAKLIPNGSGGYITAYPILGP
jgi:RHS repeat-associated protein